MMLGFCTSGGRSQGRGCPNAVPIPPLRAVLRSGHGNIRCRHNSTNAPGIVESRFFLALGVRQNGMWQCVTAILVKLERQSVEQP